jgi:hypothetical protein
MTVKINKVGKFPEIVNLRDGLTAEQVITQVRKTVGSFKFQVEIEHEGKWLNGFEYNKTLETA